MKYHSGTIKSINTLSEWILFNRLIAVLINLVLIYSIPTPASAEVYKWIDENGRVHYGDKPGNSNSKKITIKENYTANSSDLKRESSRQRILEVMKQERQTKREQQEQARKQARTNKINCDHAKTRLTSMENSSYLMEKTDDPYNPKILTESERQTATNDAKKAVNYWCAR